MFSSTLYIVPVVLIVTLVLITASVKILREYERAVVFTLGRFQAVKGPGLILMIPFVQEMVRVDLRIRVIEIPSQDVISRDNVSMKGRRERGGGIGGGGGWWWEGEVRCG